ncbi:MAG: LysM peptidoglycan-binding domain-containing protein [Verrucomicrobiota bacterium]
MQYRYCFLSNSLLLAGLALLVSCQPLQKGLDAEDDRNPYFRRASKLTAEQNFHAAIKEYENALRANPDVARAHVQIGLLYLDKLGDPVSAIYHFQRYLNATPSAPDKDQLLTYIDKAKIDFAITLPNSTAQNADEFARLKKENVELRQALAETQASLAKARDDISKGNIPSTPQFDSPAPVATSSTVAPPKAKPVALEMDTSPTPIVIPAEPGTTLSSNRIHVISPGDSLWKIARIYYPNSINEGVEKIKIANPGKASNPKNLKLGVELIIPE